MVNHCSRTKFCNIEILTTYGYNEKGCRISSRKVPQGKKPGLSQDPPGPLAMSLSKVGWNKTEMPCHWTVLT